MKSKVAFLPLCLLFALTLCSCQSATQSDTTTPATKIISASFVNEENAWSWSIEGDCAPCHTDETCSLKTLACVLDAYDNSGDTQCILCHTDTEGLSLVHTDIQNAKQAAKTNASTVDSATCTNCHDKAGLADRTTTFSELTDINGATINPHDLPINQSHSTFQCSDCHNPHSETSTLDTTREACLSCHHSGVYECYTCHN